MTFDEFMKKADFEISRIAAGMVSQDFADARWRDLYDDLDLGGADALDADARQAGFDCLAEADDIFAAILAGYEDASES